MEDRKQTLLKTIIDEHIHTGEAVGSKLVAGKYHFDVSPATIRSEMNDLEREGYIAQPHTSAGRVPTEKGWRFYLDHFAADRKLTPKERKVLEQATGIKESYEQLVKNVSRALADLSQSAVIVGFERENVYYTGISNLFHQPEFDDLDLVYHISNMVDHLDSVMATLFDRVTDDVQAYIGRENPFGQECGSLVTRYWIGNEQSGMFGILGPIRMDYASNRSLLRYAKELLKERR